MTSWPQYDPRLPLPYLETPFRSLTSHEQLKVLHVACHPLRDSSEWFIVDDRASRSSFASVGTERRDVKNRSQEEGRLHARSRAHRLRVELARRKAKLASR
jgi:hypothetical protein